MSLVIALLWLVPWLSAPEHSSEGARWRVTLIRVKPGHMGECLTNPRQGANLLLKQVADKRQDIHEIASEEDLEEIFLK